MKILTYMMSSLSKIKKIKGVAARDKADKAYDRTHGIKQGSKKDKALDKKTGVYKYEYGSKKSYGKKKKGY